MVEKKRILFVINPISGGSAKTAFKKHVLDVLDLNKFDPTFQQTNYANHAFEIGKQAVVEGYDAVIAVGGDGTINELGSALVNSKVPLGIIPQGSGNGLALYLGIPMNHTAAIRRINKFDALDIDSAKLNGHHFFNMAGIGFDASVSKTFADDNIRGPLGYLRAIVRVLSKYKSSRYNILIDGKSFEREAFMISVANSPQYGNNAYIAPKASVNDGWLDVCIVHQFPLYILPKMVFHLFTKSAEDSNYVEIIPGKKIEIECLNGATVHIDGEPIEIAGNLNIEILPKSLKIIC